MTASCLYLKQIIKKKNQSFPGRALAEHGIQHLHLASTKLYNSLSSVIFFKIKVFKAEREILHLHLAVPGGMQASSRTALCAACVPLYVSCSLEHKTVVWKESRQTTRLDQSWHQTSNSSLVQKSTKQGS